MGKHVTQIHPKLSPLKVILHVVFVLYVMIYQNSYTVFFIVATEKLQSYDVMLEPLAFSGDSTSVAHRYLLAEIKIASLGRCFQKL